MLLAQVITSFQMQLVKGYNWSNIVHYTPSAIEIFVLLNWEMAIVNACYFLVNMLVIELHGWS